MSHLQELQHPLQLQIIFAFITNSNSLLADGIHNLGDVLGLMLAWGANAMLAQRENSTKRVRAMTARGGTTRI